MIMIIIRIRTVIIFAVIVRQPPLSSMKLEIPALLFFVLYTPCMYGRAGTPVIPALQ